MLKMWIWLFFAALLALFSGPAAFAMAIAGKLDPGDLYLVVVPAWDDAFQRTLHDAGATTIGPLDRFMTEMIHAPPAAHSQLLQAGYLLFPTGTLAAICKLDRDTMPLKWRN